MTLPLHFRAVGGWDRLSDARTLMELCTHPPFGLGPTDGGRGEKGDGTRHSPVDHEAEPRVLGSATDLGFEPQARQRRVASLVQRTPKRKKKKAAGRRSARTSTKRHRRVQAVGHRRRLSINWRH